MAGTPASRSLTGSAPVTRVGMASGTADLQRDPGGAMFNSLFGALLAAGYTAAMATAIASQPDASQVPASVTGSLEMSYAGAQTVAAQYPQYAALITSSAKTAFLAGDQYAYLAGIIAILTVRCWCSLSFQNWTRSISCWPSITKKIWRQWPRRFRPNLKRRRLRPIP
jgi:MFS transporter, DHA2 family, multidrug resistance protein